MQTLEAGVQGMRLVVKLNMDRLLCLGALTGALWVSAYIATL
jgi:hypothetical protein